MHELLCRWVDEANSKEHLIPFITEKWMTIQLVVGDDCYYIEIDGGKVGLYEKCQSQIDVYIEGREDAVRALIAGEIKLRDVNQNHTIKLQSTLRNSLYAETLFKLSYISD